MEFLEAKLYQTIQNTYQYMERTGREESLERFPYLGLLAGRAQTCGEALRQAGDLQTDRYSRLLALLSDGKHDGVLENLIDLALAVMQEPEFSAYLHYFTGNRATLQLAYGMAGISYPAYSDVTEKWRRLRNIFCTEEKAPLTCANIDGNHELLAYLTGHDGKNPMLEWAQRFDPAEELHPMYVRAELAETGARLLTAGGGENALSAGKGAALQIAGKGAVLQIAGAGPALQIAGSGGRRFLAKHIAKRMKRSMLIIRVGAVWEAGGARAERMAQAIRSACLWGDLVCIYGSAEEDAFFSDAVCPFLEAGIFVILCTDSQTTFDGRGAGRVSRIDLQPLSRKEREILWREFAETYAFPEDPGVCSVRYRLNASEIARAVERWRSVCASDEKADRISKFCLWESVSEGKPGFGQIVAPEIGFPNLMISAHMQKTLQEICCGAARGYRMYEEWGLKACYPYGRAISVLLAGPPGTGKTMTAHVIAHELGVLLYQIDLSHIMDKYIGETEKHLEQAFSFAEKTNMVLFFDEADALFGKRAEVAEGKDRYANAQVSYLLQRIERYDGVVVLATNFYQNIDKAFLRRMKYVLKYQAPDESLRRLIWESCLVPELPREAIDTAYLAGQFELTGGMIKNIMQCACITAVCEERPLCMDHILGAIRMEFEKMERVITPELWGNSDIL